LAVLGYGNSLSCFGSISSFFDGAAGILVELHPPEA